jgi:hypothetical protein
MDLDAKKALRVIYNRGIVRGKDVKRLAAIDTTSKFSEILRTLESDKYITVQRGACSASDEGSLEAFVAPLPSKKAQGEYEIG